MPGNRTPISIDDEQPPVEERLAGADGVFVGLDFDGTLAPIREDPDEPTITAENLQAVQRLRDRPGAAVAVISGRALSDLVSRVDVDGIAYAGNHGLELRPDGEPDVHPTAANHRSTVRRACDRLRERLDGVPGWEIEDKGVTASIHVRGTPADRVPEVRSVLSTVVDELGGDLDVVSGKQVYELRPPIQRDKGTALELLREDAPEEWQTTYVGDDTTDEDAFAAIDPDGVGVAVGEVEETAADYRLSEQREVAPFLEWIADEVLDPTS